MRLLFRTIMILGFTPCFLWSEDWPTWRYDGARNASTPHELPSALALRWSRKRPLIRRAWPNDPQQRLGFDRSYEPVVMGDRMYLSSPNDGSVRAYDIESGKEVWSFFTEGPVRFAPAGWQDRIVIGSDDGYLYCLSADDGSLRWKFRGAPADRPDRRQLGNGNLVSFWPVRGGPVIVDGTVYFGCGVWSVNGIFLYALDVETGEVRWENGRLDNIASVRIHHEMFNDEGLSPQGYFAATRDRLVVPSGRSLPAGLDLETGRIVYWVRGFHHGDSRLAIHGDLAFAGKSAVINTYDFREVGSRWAYAGPEGPTGYNAGWGNNHVGNPDKADMGEAPWAPYKFVEACDADSAFCDGLAYGVKDGTVYAYAVDRAQNVDLPQTFRNKKVMIWTWEPPLKWKLETGHAGEGCPMVKAGGRVYGSAGKTLFALDVQAQEPALAWSMEVVGSPTALVAAHGKLIVATAEGWIHCFGDADAALSPAVFEAPVAAAEAREDAAAQKAEAIWKATGVGAGYALVLGLEDGLLVEALLAQTELRMIAVDADAAKVDAMRRRFSGDRLLGPRIQFFTGEPLSFPFPSYLASLVVSEKAAAVDFPFAADAVQMLERLRPYGGTLCLATDPGRERDFDAWAAAAEKAEPVQIRHTDGMSLLIRAQALPGSAPWTHDPADAARTYTSRDDRVRAPLGVLWYGDVEGSDGAGRYWRDRPLANRGQIFMNVSQSFPRMMSYDAYTGRFLWTGGIQTKARGYGIAAMSDGVHIAADGRYVVLDLKDGGEQANHRFAPEKTTRVKELRVEGDSVLIGFDPETESGELEAGVTTVLCLDRSSGAELWRRDAAFRIMPESLVIGGGLVFCVDAVPVAEVAKAARRGKQAAGADASTVLALDARTGVVVWEVRTAYNHENKATKEDWLAYSQDAEVLVGGRLDRASAWDAKTGKVRWENRIVGTEPALLRGGEIITFPVPKEVTVLDLLTGEPLNRFIPGRRRGCNQYLGGQHLISARDGSAAYFDMEEGKAHQMINLRSGCYNTLIQAEGMLNAPWGSRHSCRCSYPFLTSSALVHMPEVEAWRSPEPLPMTAPPARVIP